MGTKREEKAIEYIEFCEENKENEKETYEELKRLVLQFIQSPGPERLDVLGARVAESESGELYKHSGKLNRAAQLYRIIREEYKSGEMRFAQGAKCFEDLDNKYEETVFAIRRIMLDIDEQMVSKAMEYIDAEHPSYPLISEIAGKEFKCQEQEVLQIMGELYRKFGFDDLACVGENND